MTLAQFSGFILICQMVWLVYDTTRFVSGASYNGNGIYHITINAWFRGNPAYKRWLRRNSVYHWCILLIVALCPMILLLIEPFRHNNMFVRPEISLVINILLWMAILMTNKRLYAHYDK